MKVPQKAAPPGQGYFRLLGSFTFCFHPKSATITNHQREETTGDDGLRKLWRHQSRRSRSVLPVWAQFRRKCPGRKTR